MGEWMKRSESGMPFQDWCPFPPDAIVQIRNAFCDTRIGPAKSFWWGYETEFGEISEGVIVKARRLDRPKEAK
jgi:hypothetical protein